MYIIDLVTVGLQGVGSGDRADRVDRGNGLGRKAWMVLPGQSSCNSVLAISIFNRDYSDGYRMGNAVTLLLIGHKMGYPLNGVIHVYYNGHVNHH